MKKFIASILFATAVFLTSCSSSSTTPVKLTDGAEVLAYDVTGAPGDSVTLMSANYGDTWTACDYRAESGAVTLTPADGAPGTILYVNGVIK